LDRLEQWRMQAEELRRQAGAATTGPGRQLAGFSVVLLQGDMRPQRGDGDRIPAAVEKAVADMKAFLPYASYQLLDTQWMLGDGRVVGRLQRPGQAYELSIRAATNGSGISVSEFVLKEVAGSVIPGGSTSSVHQLEAQLIDSRREYHQLMERLQKGLVPRDEVAKAELEMTRLMERLDQEIQSSRPSAHGDTIISSTFRMNLGETVVVGTSRISGDQALIVLLTAVGK
jgi:hypothetical protein